MLRSSCIGCSAACAGRQCLLSGPPPVAAQLAAQLRLLNMRNSLVIRAFIQVNLAAIAASNPVEWHF